MSIMKCSLLLGFPIGFLKFMVKLYLMNVMHNIYLSLSASFKTTNGDTIVELFYYMIMLGLILW